MEDRLLPEIAYRNFSVGGLDWTDRRLWDQFAEHTARDGDMLAVIDAAGREWRRDELRQLAVPLAAHLAELGVGPNTRVLVEARKEIAIVAAVLAISSLGAIICPYGTGLSETDRGELEKRLGHVLRVFTQPNSADARGVSALAFAIPDNVGARSVDPRDAEVALIGFTSGTTGVPKAVMHGPAALNYATRACAQIAGLQQGEPILGIVPWDSAPGFTFTVHFGLSLGHPIAIVDPWSPVGALQMAAKYHCVWAICVPTHLYSMVEAVRTGQWEGKLNFRALAVGGSAMTPELITDAQELLGIPALRMFGMSECMGHASTRLGDSMERRFHSDGLPFPGTRDAAFDSELRMLAPGERGQAGVRGPSLFLGYCDGLGDGSAHMAADGFLLTGDEIICDQQGYLKVVGRIKDQIIRGGFNIDPAEVEAAILRHGGVAEVVIVGIPHQRLGEQCCAVCRMLPGVAPIDLAAMQAHLGVVGLSKKKWPEYVLVVDKLEHNANGKIDKRKMTVFACEALAGQATH
jgi:acyl-CoA synthetase